MEYMFILNVIAVGRVGSVSIVLGAQHIQHAENNTPC